MALSREDKKDVAASFGKKAANAVSHATRDGHKSSGYDKAFKSRETGKKYEIKKDAVGGKMLSTVRGKQPISGYRTMSGSSRHNARMSRTFDNAMEDRRDPVHKSFNRHYRRHERGK